ncbi:galactose mutarotase [Sutcliffiella horikoshii]|uniref:aldose epimerase family protein n=1 Tax=Sutcliffiella horikoshii TaxID=79883 RepID=UPI00203DDA5C|nr:aldose epimerase family protein [Sutcliffiella horikoshii]MCM3619843.1 galactose mutarotase [Sutcliffiella horikoshii]
MKIETLKLPNNWKQFNLYNDNGMLVSLIDYGGIILKIDIPDKEGNFKNVIVGYKNYSSYEKNPPYFGALIGRVAGRIQGATFEVDGEVYKLETNEHGNHLHGGSHGFHQVVWKSEIIKREDGIGVKLSHFSKDGEGGYPGNIDVSVLYLLNNDNELILEYTASTDKLTPFAMTNHSYFNLGGNPQDSILPHSLKLESDRFVELDEDLIPTGKISEVANTPFDFRTERLFNNGINEGNEQNQIAGSGYDHYFLFQQTEKEKVVLKDGKSGRILSIQTDQPGMVLYTANNLASNSTFNEPSFSRYSGVCFETQGSPASLHHDGFPDILLHPDETYRQRTVYRFSVDE